SASTPRPASRSRTRRPGLSPPRPRGCTSSGSRRSRGWPSRRPPTSSCRRSPILPYGGREACGTRRLTSLRAVPPVASFGDDLSAFGDAVSSFFDRLAQISAKPLLIGLAFFIAYLSVRAAAFRNVLRAAYPEEP